MTEWQAVRYIGVYLWRKERFGVLTTLLFSIYLSFIISTTVDALLDPSDEVPKWLNAMVDWLYLSMFPIFGMVMNQLTWGIWRNDFYSRRLAHWRTMPIPVASIVKARMLQSAIMMPIIGAVFMTVQYAVASHLREEVTPFEWLQVGIAWACYAFAILVVFIWLELGFSGKRYCLYYFGIMFAIVVAAVTLTWRNVFVFQEVLGIVQRGYGWALILGLAVVAGISTAMFLRMAEARIRVRSLPL